MIEIDGPKTAFFESGNNIRYVYEVHAVGRYGTSPVEVLQAYADWRTAYEDIDSILIWRNRPELRHTKDEEGTEFYQMYCRCVKIPRLDYTYPFPVKQEGERMLFIA